MKATAYTHLHYNYGLYDVCDVQTFSDDNNAAATLKEFCQFSVLSIYLQI